MMAFYFAYFLRFSLVVLPFSFRRVAQSTKKTHNKRFQLLL